MRLNNCTIFWKQREFLHGLDNLQKLFPVGAIRRLIFSFFTNQNFSRDREAKLLCKWISLVLQVKLSKEYSIRKEIAWLLSSQLIVILFLRNSQLQRDIYQTFFSPIILRIFRKFLQRIKKAFRKFLDSSLKKKGKIFGEALF